MSKIKINLDALKAKREWVRHKVLEGNNIYRFLPPFGEDSNGYPFKRWMVTWGLLDPQSGRLRPYASSITTSEKACPIMEYVKALSDKAETIKAELKASGATDEQVKERLKELNKLISNLRPKGVYAWNAVDKAGKVGLLEIKSTAHKKLKELMSDYINDYGQDPTSVNSDEDDSGMWFNIKRSGTGFNTEYDVEKVQSKTKINGQLTFVDDRSPLQEDVKENWEDKAYDLASIYQVKEYDELKEVLMANMPRIIEECSDALIPGFEPNSAPISGAAASVHEPAYKSNNKVTTKFDEPEDDSDADQATINTADSNDDLLSLADDILNT